MDAFLLHTSVVSSYRKYLTSFISVQDERIADCIQEAFHENGFIPEPLIQFNPSFQKQKGLADLVSENKIHPDLPKALGNYALFRHQIEALEKGINDESFIVTSGTGSGKSLTFLATVFNHILKMGDKKEKGVKAILVYPMNALINSQEEEIKKYAINYLETFPCQTRIVKDGKSLDEIISQLESGTGKKFPITFSKYTGQENEVVRAQNKIDQPDVILTNYMMLELIMTRESENWMRDSMKNHLKYLVFDEMHTYRGRQGADVSMLIRRIRGWVDQSIIFIGTSATMVSLGTPLEKKMAVAKVGNTIFGTSIEPSNVILEYLQTCTNGIEPNSSDLRKACESEISQLGSEESFITNPLSNWLELNIALKFNEGQLERGKPKSITEIAKLLVKATEISEEQAIKVIGELMRWAEFLNNKPDNRNLRKSYLPYRFHQFISQTSIAQVTLHSRAQRHITIKPGRYIKTDKGEHVLFPVLFSRISGYDFLCVELDTQSKIIKPRNPDDSFKSLTLKDAKSKTLTPEDFKYGYIVPDEGEEFWNDDFNQVIPDSWLAKNGSQPLEYYQWHMPRRIYYNSDCKYSDENLNDNYPLKGFFIAANLKIDPTAGIVYDETKVSEKTKLMRLGSEGRSTATTILSYAVVDALNAQGEVKKDQKIMSFTDNRQDASLQAGHFNDFISTVRLRSALNQTLLKNPDGLNIHNVAERLFETIKLKEEDYAKKPSEDPDFPEPFNILAIKHYILYRVLQDLNRSWRYTLPNLEQTALLKIEYKDIGKLSSLDNRFEKIAPFNQLTKEKREEALIQVLNYFRTNFSIDHRMLLDERGEIENQLKDQLDSKKLWSLDSSERFEVPRYLTVVNPGRTPRGLYTSSIGPQSGLGKFIKRLYQETLNETPDRETLRGILESLYELLVRTNFLSRNEKIKGDKTNGLYVNGYLLRSDCLIWKTGDKKNVGIDFTRINAFRDFNIKPNIFYQDLYQREFSKYEKEFIGREHTGQLDTPDRIEREKLFRNGEISALFCSPTMELGIDIANLNIVHMRNVPPNPANYAQRSGRAGRSGQTALVFTFCSALSPHDQNYFRSSDTMVSGSVTPPRLDLYNDELLLTHLNAFLLMKLQISDVKSCIDEVLNMDKSGELPVKSMIKNQIDENIRMHAADWSQEFNQYIQKLIPGLEATWWYNADWIGKNVRNFYTEFNNAFDRWRRLFKAAEQMIIKSRMIMDDPRIKSDTEQARDAKRRHAIGLNQRDILKNKTTSGIDNLSEFYIFRYLASEGFIPGYNFTRLPVRAFLGYKFNNSGSYISRPRFVALREFGPNNLVYHNGAKHKMTRMMVANTESLQRQLKVSLETGYAFLDDEAEKANNDPITHTEFTGNNFEKHGKVIEISEAEAFPQERISCQEEDRVSQGYEIDYYFNYPAGIEHTKQSVIKRNGMPMLNLIYGPSTKLIALNKQWRKSSSPGFSLDPENGKWLSQEDLKNEAVRKREQKVKIFAQDTADSLYIQPLDNLKLNENQVISLSFALKRGIEQLFQVEENEIAISILGKSESRNLLIYESAQGSLGILSQLINEPLKLKEVFIEAYRAMHFDPDTRTETEQGLKTEKASYLDLLSYYNQRYHEQLDRHDIKEALEFLIDCDVEVPQQGNDRDSHFKMLLEEYDKNSATELVLLRYLFENGLSLPDKAQVNVKEFYINADFVYNHSHGPVLIFCDGTIHDKLDIKRDDDHKRELLYTKGYDVIVWHHSESLEKLVERRKDVFRKVC
jgi:superfamily II DNA/RNA helicase